MTIRDDARRFLSRVGTLDDDAIDLAETALVLASVDTDRPLDPYRAHLGQLEADARTAGDGADTASERLAALNAVLVAQHGYGGDRDAYDDLRNANLMHVIDHRRGLPVVIGILYLHVARALGWPMVGLNFPGHFLVRLDGAGERLIVDPFNAGRACAVGDLRDMLKATVGMEAELEPAHYQPVSNRDVLIRLQNNRKLRHINDGDLARALNELATMRLFAPAEPSLWQETGLLEAHHGRTRDAIDALEEFLRLSGGDRHAQQVAAMIRQLRARLD